MGRKAYGTTHPEEWKVYTKEYRILNSDREKERHKAYREANKGKLKVYRRSYKAQKRRDDPYFRLKCNLRSRIYDALVNGYKSGNTETLLGASFEVVHGYLTNLLLPGMTWENYGRDTWHIDHIIPCAAFDLTDAEQQKKCFHYTNLQPLWAKDHFAKTASESKQITRLG